MSKNGKDISGSEVTYPHQASISSPKYALNDNNRAQKSASEDSDDSEDIFRNKGGNPPLTEEEKAEARAKYDAARKRIRRKSK